MGSTELGRMMTWICFSGCIGGHFRFKTIVERSDCTHTDAFALFIIRKEPDHGIMGLRV